MNGLSFGEFENSSFDSLYSRIAQSFCGVSLACQMAQSQQICEAKGLDICESTQDENHWHFIYDILHH